ncbi:hypothetical protein N7452_002407 [Penicillium brevicompactum]|uniref:Tc1-like transposase DDE domain-containing protein n=1 Tax=Penicillium brevicompactum TaxID=5074 RepID=A0A9W9QUQ4_PENBR|nr:hypothetical protein N7452_002407 [Penicillium brevicompactum]
MARNLQAWQRKLIMAKVAKCNERSVTNIRRNIRVFGDSRSPPVPAGQPSIITPVMLDALCDHLAEKPGLYVEEMALFLWDEFEVLPSPSSVKRALTRAGWTKRKPSREQKNRILNYEISTSISYRNLARIIWSLLMNRDVINAWDIDGLDGVILSRIFKGSTDASFFESFIEQLLQHCGKWPEPKSVLVMDNASFHHSDRIQQLCSDAGVKLLYLPPYSPDFNPIEEFFAELKAYIKKAWSTYEQNPDQGFDVFLRRCVHEVGAKQQSAEGHFRHAGITVEKA